MKPVITVIMPVYNGQEYLEETLDSLKRQDFQEFTVLCINDSSVDLSLEILEKYGRADSRFKIINTAHNLGNASVVLSHYQDLIDTQYFIYTSQDDTFAKDWLTRLYLRAIETGADAVIPRVHCTHNKNRSLDKYFDGVSGNISAILSGRHAFELSVKWQIPGNALWSIKLLRKYGFFDFSYNADEYTVRLYLLQSSKVVFADTIFYYRQNNKNAITKKFSEKWFLSPLTEIYLWELSIEHKLDKSLQHYLLRRAVRQILFFYPYTFIPRYFDSRALLKHCLEECTRVEMLEYINNNKVREFFPEWWALNSRAGFFVTSLTTVIKNFIPFVRVVLNLK